MVSCPWEKRLEVTKRNPRKERTYFIGLPLNNDKFFVRYPMQDYYATLSFNLNKNKYLFNIV